MRPSKVMSYTGFLCTTVPANAQLLRASPTQACPPWGQTAQVCSKPSVCCWGARWMPLQGLWGLNSSCVRDDSMYESSRLFPLIHSVKLSWETLTPSGSPNQSTSIGWHQQAERALVLERVTCPCTKLVPGDDTILSSPNSTATANVSNVYKILT